MSWLDVSLLIGVAYVTYVAAESFVRKTLRRWGRRNAPQLFVPTAEEFAAWHAGEQRDYSHLGWSQPATLSDDREAP